MSDSLGLECIGCELSHGYWEPDLGPLEERQVLLTTEPSLLSHLFFFVALFLAVSIFKMFYCNKKLA